MLSFEYSLVYETLSFSGEGNRDINQASPPFLVIISLRTLPFIQRVRVSRKLKILDFSPQDPRGWLFQASHRECQSVGLKKLNQ